MGDESKMGRGREFLMNIISVPGPLNSRRLSLFESRRLSVDTESLITRDPSRHHPFDEYLRRSIEISALDPVAPPNCVTYVTGIPPF